uniref:Dynein light chain n=1 Tax=Clytia hemisphaerica TaxID=252671 RepID=A0A7M5U028_9CNID|eukprot:TCONS_00021590-protein
MNRPRDPVVEGNPSRKISLFQVIPRMLRLRKVKSVTFSVVHYDEPRGDTRQSTDSFLSSITDTEGNKREERNWSNSFIVPSPHLLISFDAISAIMKDACSLVTNGNLQSSDEVKKMLPRITDFTKSAIKDINLDRYRVIVTTYIIYGHTFQGRYASGFLWDQTMDRSVEYRHSIHNGTLVCVAYLIYME